VTGSKIKRHTTAVTAIGWMRPPAAGGFSNAGVPDATKWSRVESESVELHKLDVKQQVGHTQHRLMFWLASGWHFTMRSMMDRSCPAPY
jgi:hypothetical protein